MPFVTQGPDGSCRLSVYVQPKASKNGFIALHGEAIKLAITAAPVDNKANKAVIAFLSSFFAIPKRDIMICGGKNSRNKSLRIQGLSPAEIRSNIEQQLFRVKS